MKPCSPSLGAAGVALVLGIVATPVRADVLYVSNDGNGTIETFTSGGADSVFASSGLIGPRGLAFDSASNLYVSDVNQSAIFKLTPAAAALSLSATE